MIENEYKYRINKVIDYIEKNLNEDLSLQDLAQISNFSKYHFSRIFLAVTGETVFQLILRLRLERTASLLVHSRDSISDIAFASGFKSLSVFSKNFTSYYSESATNFRKKNSNLNKVNSNLTKNHLESSLYICNQTKSIKWKTNMKNLESIEIKELPNIPVIYIRHTGPYQGDNELFETLFSKLFAWAGPRGLLDSGPFKTAIVYHDDVNVADKSKLRTSVCLTASENTVVDGEIGKMTLEKGKYVIGKFTVNAEEFQEAWDWLMGSWFPTSGYIPDDKLCFELYPEEPDNGLFKVEICVPIKI